jgi:hypothetical protein
LENQINRLERKYLFNKLGISEKNRGIEIHSIITYAMPSAGSNAITFQTKKPGHEIMNLDFDNATGEIFYDGIIYGAAMVSLDKLSMSYKKNYKLVLFDVSNTDFIMQYKDIGLPQRCQKCQSKLLQLLK